VERAVGACARPEAVDAFPLAVVPAEAASVAVPQLVPAEREAAVEAAPPKRAALAVSPALGAVSLAAGPWPAGVLWVPVLAWPRVPAWPVQAPEPPPRPEAD
jgi:hypothetical protein